MRIVVAVGGDLGRRIARDVEDEGAEIVAVVEPGGLASAAGDRSSDTADAVREADAVVLRAARQVLVPEVVAMCDRGATRIIALADRAAEHRAVAAFGLPAALALDASAEEIVEAARSRTLGMAPAEAPAGSVTVVWGPHGAPGRSTLALALAAARAPRGRVALIDADSHAPSIAQMLGLPDEAPGFPAACRQTDYGILDGLELTRLSAPVDLGDGAVEVLTGINRPARWPELSRDRVRAVLEAARGWADETFVDVAAPLEADEEIVSDLDGPRRNASALAAIDSADRILAVVSADPVGVARFVRGWTQLRERAPSADVRVVVNRVRPGPLGIDARGQAARALEQLIDVRDPHFLPHDLRAADRAQRDRAPVRALRRRSPLAQAVMHLAATL